MAKSGRSRWAAIATGGLLALTTAAAALLSHHRSQEAVGLLESEPKSLSQMSMSLKMPAGWEAGTTHAGRDVAFVKLQGLGRDAGRRMVLFRAGDRYDLRTLVRGAVRFAVPQAEVSLPDHRETSSFGGLRSDLFLLVAMPAVGRGDQPFWGLVNAAIAPDLQTVGLVFMSESEFTPRDRRLFDAVSRSIEFDATPLEPADPNPPAVPDGMEEESVPIEYDGPGETPVVRHDPGGPVCTARMQPAAG